MTLIECFIEIQLNLYIKIHMLHNKEILISLSKIIWCFDFVMYPDFINTEYY